MPARDYPFEAAFGYDRQLIYVFTSHRFQRFNDRRIGRDRAETFERAHYAIYCRVWPACAVYLLDLMCRYQPGHQAILDDQEATASRAQQMLLRKGLEIRAAIHNGAVAFHHILDAQSAQAFGDSHPHIAGAGRVEQEPADEGYPKPTEARASEEPDQTERNEAERDKLAYLLGDSGRAGSNSSPTSGIRWQRNHHPPGLRTSSDSADARPPASCRPPARLMKAHFRPPSRADRFPPSDADPGF
jgi:hypothetical protein